MLGNSLSPRADALISRDGLGLKYYLLTVAVLRRDQMHRYCRIARLRKSADAPSSQLSHRQFTLGIEVGTALIVLP
jgi:hypothetical protein